MSLNFLGRMRPTSRAAAISAAVASALLIAACANAPTIPPAEQPLTKQTLDLLGKKGMDPGAPLFVRIFKEDSELEVWKARDDGRYYHFKTYPICNWSGDLGPKQKQGDKQAPEGFYNVSAGQMNPHSQFHLAFNLGYPNAFDRSHGRTGDFLMVHGKCKSAGCYAMTDALIEEIYALARESFKAGQTSIPVHAYPFRMTTANLVRHKKHPAMPFWQSLKPGYDHFETHRVPPSVAVCERRYVVNVKYNGSVDPAGACPAFERPLLEPFVPKPAEQQLAEERITVPGPKTRTAENIASLSSQIQTASTNAPASPAASQPAASQTPAFGLGLSIESAARALGFSQK
jgi:murein L,D-transpeptidase YafK